MKALKTNNKVYRQIVVPICNLWNSPSKNSILETQLLFGETIEILNEKKDWIYCKSLSDKYKGWIQKENLGKVTPFTHLVSHPMCHCYEKDNIKSNIVNKLFFNSRVRVIEEKKIGLFV